MVASPRHRPNLTILLAFSAIVIFLGSNFVAVKFSNLELPPLWGASIRFMVASAILFLLVAGLHLRLPRGRALLGAVLFGVLAFGLTYGLAYWGLVKVSAGTTSIVFATLPLLTLLFAILIGQERFRLRSLTGALVVLAGVSLTFLAQLQLDVPLVYLAAVLGSAVVAALSGVVVKHFPPSHPVCVNAVAMSVGAVILLAASLAGGEPWRLPEQSQTWVALAWLIVSSIVAFILMIWVLHRWTASATSYSMVLAPLVTVIVAAWLMGESITGSFMFGSFLVLLGVYIGALQNPGSVPGVRSRHELETRGNL